MWDGGGNVDVGCVCEGYCGECVDGWIWVDVVGVMMGVGRGGRVVEGRAVFRRDARRGRLRVGVIGCGVIGCGVGECVRGWEVVSGGGI